MQQAGPVAPADLQQVPHRGREAPGLGLRLPPGPAQPVPPPLHGGPCVRGVMRQDGRGAMDPAIGSTPLRPQRRRRVPPTPQDRPQAPSGLGHGPLFSTRSRLSVMALRRAWSCRPAAAKGGRPSSVRALRTARQYPRMTSASGSVSLHSPCQGAHATDVFFEDLLGMAVRLIDRLGGFVQGVKVPQVMGHLG
jgi:hypothetical protein